jgi:hypothetical protein
LAISKDLLLKVSIEHVFWSLKSSHIVILQLCTWYFLGEGYHQIFSTMSVVTSGGWSQGQQSIGFRIILLLLELWVPFQVSALLALIQANSRYNSRTTFIPICQLPGKHLFFLPVFFILASGKFYTNLSSIVWTLSILIYWD